MEAEEALRFPFRLTVGVTGHRRLHDTEELATRVNEALDVHVPALLDAASRSLVSDSGLTQPSFTVLTPLAEGADRCVARTILERPGSRLEVILPLAEQDYLEDFGTSASRAEFQRLLALASRPISLRERPLATDYPPDELAAARARAYEELGRRIVNDCDVLIAVWDGEPARGKGGTAEVVAYARDSGRPVVVIPTNRPGSVEVYPGAGIQPR